MYWILLQLNILATSLVNHTALKQFTINMPHHCATSPMQVGLTLNGEIALISPNSVAFGADYVKVVEDTAILSATEM